MILSIPNPLCLERGLGGGFEGVCTERKVRPLKVLQTGTANYGVCVCVGGGGGGGGARLKKFPI